MDTAIGIDLGTTNSAICYINDIGVPEVITNSDGGKTTPSVVQLHADGTASIGETAKRSIVLDRENTAHFFKRDMGTDASYLYHGKAYTPVDLSAMVLKTLKEDAEKYIGRSIHEAVITVPAYFHNNAREETRRAGEIAGLRVTQIINEPTAAALAYGLRDTGREETVLVYDLGGGTFDISLVKISPSSIDVLGTDGNHSLGGKDWDDRIVQYIADEFRAKHNSDPLDDPLLFQELLVRAEEAKKTLTASQRTSISVNYDGRMERIEITREIFESITKDLLGQTSLLIQQVLQETDFSLEQITSVLMVGGSTRMPSCRRLIEQLTGRTPNLGVNPDECVAIGAAIQASQLHPQPTLRLGAGRRVKDVMSHSMGMIAESSSRDRYLNTILIPKNIEIPTSQTNPFKVRVAKGRTASISVYVTQGESDDPTPGACTYVGKYVISDIPSVPSGDSIVDITYEYDRDGVVHVSAVIRGAGATLPVERQPLPDDMSWVCRPPAQAPEIEHTTIYTSVDLSGSMSGRPLQDAQHAIEGFIKNIDLTHSSVGLIRFADTVKVDVVANQNAKELMTSIRRWAIGAVGYGNGTHPFNDAYQLFAKVKGRKILVVLTDGVWSHQSAAESAAKKCHEANIEIIAIGFGSADKKFLDRIATADQSALFSSSGDLRQAMEQIAQVVVESRSGLTFKR